MYDENTLHQSAERLKRILAALAFLIGGFSAEMLRPFNCNLIHRAAVQQPKRARL